MDKDNVLYKYNKINWKEVANLQKILRSKIMIQNPKVLLKGLVKKVENRSFKGKEGEKIPLLYAYVEQEDVMSLAEIQIKPVTRIIKAGDKFNEEVEIKIQKDQKGGNRIVFVSRLPETVDKIL